MSRDAEGRSQVGEVIPSPVKGKLPSIAIVGIEGARIRDVDVLLSELAELGEFQLIDAGLVLGEEHLRFASFEALRAFQVGRNVTSSLPMEILVKGACTTQISEAIARLGVKPGHEELVLVAIDADGRAIGRAVALTGGTRSQAPLAYNPGKRRRVKRAFSLAEPVEKTLLEKIALSSLS